MQKTLDVSPLGSEHGVAAGRRAHDRKYHVARLRSTVAEKVARFLIGFRQQHDLTQAQLAVVLDMKESAVSRLESGEHVPNFATIERISEGCNVDVLFDFSARVPDMPARRKASILA